MQTTGDDIFLCHLYLLGTVCCLMTAAVLVGLAFRNHFKTLRFAWGFLLVVLVWTIGHEAVAGPFTSYWFSRPGIQRLGRDRGRTPGFPGTPCEHAPRDDHFHVFDGAAAWCGCESQAGLGDVVVRRRGPHSGHVLEILHASRFGHDR